MPWFAAFLIFSAIIMAVFSARGFYNLLSAGLPISNPWLAITQVTLPLTQVFAGLMIATIGWKRKVFALIVFVLGIMALCCSLIAINTP